VKKVNVFGLDLAKNVFEVVGLGRREEVVVKTRLRRAQVLPWFAKQQRALVAREPCPGAHYWARELQEQGFEVKMIPSQETKRYRSGAHKNDLRDAIAIGRAALSAQVKAVPIKSEEALQIQALYRRREWLLKSRIALSNQMRMQLLEFGVALPKSDKALLAGVREALDDERLPAWFREEVLASGYEEVQQLQAKVDRLTKLIERTVRVHPIGQALLDVAGVGPLTAGYILGVMGGPGCANSARGFAARVGLVPSQNRSGDRNQLGRITKMGDRTMRRLFVQGAHSVLSVRRSDHRLRQWGDEVRSRRGYQKAVVAVANKLARYSWAVMNRCMQQQGMAV
jgi:transposase